MTAPTREEIDAKIDVAETRIDARVLAIEEGNARMVQEMQATRAAIGNLKSTMFVTAITTVLSILFGVATFNATVLSNMLASYDSGKNTAFTQADVKRAYDENRRTYEDNRRALEENTALIRSLREELQRLRAAPSQRQH